MEETIEALEKQRQERLDFIEAQYYTPTMKHYKDNERYAWAVKKINETFDELIDDEYQKNSSNDKTA